MTNRETNFIIVAEMVTGNQIVGFETKDTEKDPMCPWIQTRTKAKVRAINLESRLARCR